MPVVKRGKGGKLVVKKHNPGKGSRKIKKVMGEFKRKTLKSSSGAKVKKRKQAVAIALSEAREAGAKIPKKNNPHPRVGTTTDRNLGRGFRKSFRTIKDALKKRKKK